MDIVTSTPTSRASPHWRWPDLRHGRHAQVHDAQHHEDEGLIVMISRWNAVHTKDSGHWPHQAAWRSGEQDLTANMLPNSRKDSDSGLETRLHDVHEVR